MLNNVWNSVKHIGSTGLTFHTSFSHRGDVVLDAGEKYSFNEDGSEITILDVTKLDEGDYTCLAKNKAGESEQELSLRVFGKDTHCIYTHELKC